MTDSVCIKKLNANEKLLYKEDLILLFRELSCSAEHSLNYYIDYPENYAIFGLFISEDNLIGCAIIEDQGIHLTLYNLVINKTFQNRGYGKILLSHIELMLTREFKSLGVKELDMMLSCKYEVINFYLKNGYKEISKINRVIVSEGEDVYQEELILIKHLIAV